MISLRERWRSDRRAVARLEPLLPTGKKPGRPPKWTRRQLINGIRWRTRTGAPWRDVPERYGPWGRGYDLFRRWQRDGTWKRFLAELQARADAKHLITWDINVDSTVCRAHQHGAGRGKRGNCRSSRQAVSTSSRPTTASDARAEVRPRSCTAVEQGQKPMSFVITAGQRGDSPQFEPVLKGTQVRRPGPGRPRTRPRADYRERHAVECGINRL
ncbi:IS5 family transposase [Streptomyces avidinii]|uniref:IS5 family transposase n=1 Tax=Streptomyces avidinii TaxID=1895 RepID=UPI0038685096|nr:IS5 family transposase [Streptomyces avidinii]